jgi:hypothetical protein
MKRKIYFSILTTVLLAIFSLGVALATDGILPGGTPVSVEFTSPTDGALLSSSPGDITLQGKASVGEILPPPVPPITSELTLLNLSVDGGTPLDLSASTVPPLPQSGPVTVTFTHTVSMLTPGAHEFCAMASGSDSGGEGDVTDCINVTAAEIAMVPITATNELGTAGQTHTVTATVSAGPAGGVAGVDVNFDILSGPNAGITETATTDISGAVTFTYTATQGIAGLGTDQIQACFTDDLNVENCATAEKTWQDTTPPQVDVSVSPDLLWPPNHKYVNVEVTLNASDNVDPNPAVQLVSVTSNEPDNGVGDGNTTNDIVVLDDYHMNLRSERSGTGDGRYYTINYEVTDASGNATSASTSVFVPHDKSQAIKMGYSPILLAKLSGDPLIFLPMTTR